MIPGNNSVQGHKKQLLILLIVSISVMVCGCNNDEAARKLIQERFETEKPVISMNHEQVKMGTKDRLLIYEDGGVIYVRERGHYLPTIDNPPSRTWMTGRISEQELNMLAEMFQTEELDALLEQDDPYDKGLVFMSCEISIDYKETRKSFTIIHFVDGKDFIYYPEMTYPLNNIYGKMWDITENNTEVLYREEIEL